MEYNLNVRAKTTKLVEENIGKYHLQLGKALSNITKKITKRKSHKNCNCDKGPLCFSLALTHSVNIYYLSP